MKKLNSLILLMSITFVFGQNNAPVANDQSVSTDSFTPINITLTGSDADLTTGVLTVHTQKGSELENSAGSGFGEYIQTNLDGTRVVVGGWSQNLARVFNWDGAEWAQIGQTIDGDSGGRFGEFVSMNNGGDIIAVSDHTHDGSKGVIRVYSLNGSTWTQLGSDIDGENSGDNLGYRAMHISGNGIILAAPAFKGNYVNTYKWDGSAWNKTGTISVTGGGSGDAPGQVSLSNDGSRLAIGNRFTDSNGKVTIHDWNGSAWSEFSSIDGNSGDAFGNVLDLTDDGGKIIIGANSASLSRVYDLSSSSAVQIGSDINYKPWRAISISSDGKRVVIPVYGQKTGVFDWNGTSWNLLGGDIIDSSLWGESLDMSSDGKVITIGGHNGMVKVFDVLNLQYIITSLPTSGTLKQGTNTISSSDLPYTSKVKDPMVTYTPNTSFSGTDTFNFKLNDLIDDSNVATVTINVSGDGFNLEDDNNKIQVSSCTCNGKNDGTIDLSIEDNNYDYTISVSGQTASVLITGDNKTASVTGLAKGTYTVCFKVDGQPGYEQCFEAVIDEPKGL